MTDSSIYSIGDSIKSAHTIKGTVFDSPVDIVT